MFPQFKAHLKANLPFLEKARVLVACSGGMDSVVLAHLSVSAGLDVTLAHCNFKLRGSESDGDEQFVRNLAKELGVGVEVKSFETKKYVRQNRGSLQMIARELRYQWFNELMGAKGFDYLLTAHHVDDSLETFLINLSRGTGIDGLSGIPIQNGKVVRPLLDFPQKNLMDYAKRENLSWREDSSNSDKKYLRNKIRLEIVPKLKELHPTFLENFKQTQVHLQDSHVLMQNHLQEIKSILFADDGDVIRVAIEPLKELNPIEAYLYGLFKEYGFTEWEDVKGLLNAMSGKKVLSKTHSLLKDREYLLLSKIENRTNEVYSVHDKQTMLESPIQLKMEKVDAVEKSSPDTIFLDKKKLNFPLVLRNWQKGDYFYPYGMKGGKKLSKFFKDEKMDVFSKEKQWLLCSNDEIVWVVGRRADERFKVDKSTETIIKITFVA
ncbi:tRNA lysidine(34) synthetase TilS [Muricauda sp. CAU 1633]|uniref:tRNA lysidine(34) synthetase TilS n=1 Tax=Allomuricauda sp. CAU 1633 TaxID=2816036 RepID=UPI001A8C7E58|nr:tRNA lysidine(34) synthetase TilS [Muricauda sp. CAU 1633]MBO0323068.1 tRNA lysidine(34) synthetase TilS [Muricauda sp. CAU 1633]